MLQLWDVPEARLLLCILWTYFVFECQLPGYKKRILLGTADTHLCVHNLQEIIIVFPAE